jgi:plasmid stability protein
MREMPTLNIRNVPEHVVSALKRRAKDNGRSLNTEVVEALKEYDERHSGRAELRRQLELFRREELPPRLPGDPTPEEMIRAGREERDRRIAGDL